MRFNYTLYPESKQKLISASLVDKIKDKKEKHELPYTGYTSKSDIHEIVKGMQDEGYFNTLPKDERKELMESLEYNFKNQDENPLKIESRGKIISQETECEDFYFMTGWLASCIMSPEEIWKYQEHGFSSINNFVGSIGAVIWNQTHGNHRKGYEWTFQWNGRTFVSNITGDMNLDLRIYKTDITPDKTYDPMGKIVSYRPELEEDKQLVSPYHSEEPNFLIGVMKYVEQLNLKSAMLENKAQPLIDYTKSLGRRIGAAAECFGGYGANPMILMAHFDLPMPQLDENYMTNHPSIYNLHISSESSFGMFIGPNNELLFSRNTDCETKKIIDMQFQPDEVDHLLKGICFQSCQGLGRTVPKTLIEILEYCYSGKYEEDLKRFNEKYKH